MSNKSSSTISKAEKRKVESLLSYIRTLSTDDAINNFASNCKTTAGNLLQIAYGGSVSAKLSKQINEKSQGAVLLEDLRPDIFS